MSYFPFFAELEGVDGLIIGGGQVAFRKAERLLPYGPRLTVVAERFAPAFKTLNGTELIHGGFEERHLAGRGFAVAATDDRRLNRRIAELCREARIPVNVVDDKELCTFLFPALVKRGELSIGISTGGASPSAAVYLKEKIGELLPENMDGILAFLESQRPRIKAAVPDEKRRAALYKKLFAQCLRAGRALNGEELEDLLRERG